MVFVLIQGNSANGLLGHKGLFGKKIGMDWKQHRTSFQDTAQTLSGMKTDDVFRSKSIPVMTKHFIYQSISSNQTPRAITSNHPSKLQSSKSSTKRLRISRKQSLKDSSSLKHKNLSIVERDVHNLIQTLQKHKQEENQIISTLRGKFSQAQSKMLKNSFTIQRQPKPYMLRKRQANYFEQSQQPTILKVKNKPSNMMKTTCNTSYCNIDQFQVTNAKNQNHNANKSITLSQRIKSFKSQLRKFINSFLSTDNNPQHPKHLSNRHHPHIPPSTTKKRLLASVNTINNNHHNSMRLQGVDNLLKQQKMHNKTNYKLSNNTLTEYLYLADKSYNSLELLMKSSLARAQQESDEGDGDNMPKPVITYSSQSISHTLVKISIICYSISDKKLTLSTFRSAYKCLQPQFNPKQITIKMLLAFGINPINEFYLVPQETFSMFKRLSQNKSSRKQCREFLLRYFCYDQQKITKQQFYGSVQSLLKKLGQRGNQGTVERLYEEWKGIIEQVAQLSVESDEMNTNLVIQWPHNQPQLQQKATTSLFYSRSQIKSILTNDPLFLWQQILQLIFLV